MAMEKEDRRPAISDADAEKHGEVQKLPRNRMASMIAPKIAVLLSAALILALIVASLPAILPAIRSIQSSIN